MGRTVPSFAQTKIFASYKLIDGLPMTHIKVVTEFLDFDRIMEFTKIEIARASSSINSIIYDELCYCDEI
jgi:hypothetical protein